MISSSRIHRGRSLLAVSILAIGGGPAIAQGTVNFDTRVPGNFGAFSHGYGGIGILASSLHFAQLYKVQADGGLGLAVGVPVPFADGDDAGFITSGGIVEVPGVPPGGTVRLNLVAWDSRLGGNYLEALFKFSGGVGESGPFPVKTGGGSLPPGSLVGIRWVDISPVHPDVPEPGVCTVMLLGGVVLGIRVRSTSQTIRG